jgi:hypothetical protein
MDELNTTVSVSLPTDEDGFLSQECPTCRRRFKARFGEGSSQPISFCPYCGHHGTGCWWTEAQAEYLTAVASEKVIAPKLQEMARQFNQQSGGGLLRVRMDVKGTSVPPQPHESNDSMPLATFPCCRERIKHDGMSPELRCVICGAIGTTQ